MFACFKRTNFIGADKKLNVDFKVAIKNTKDVIAFLSEEKIQ